MNQLVEVAPEFVAMAHSIVWCSAATVDARGRPRSRILHPLWQWDGTQLIGWIGTSPTATKREHLAASPYISISYWTTSQDTCVAECKASWVLDDNGRIRVWNLFLTAPAPVGYDPTLIPAWTSPTCEAFAAIKLDPWRLRIFPGSVLMGSGGRILKWQDSG